MAHGCAEQCRAYLECVAKGAFTCGAAKCSAAVCLEQGVGLSCDAARAALRRCAAPCEGEGVVHDVARRVPVAGKPSDVKARVVRAGCGDCPKDLAAGAPPGSRCEAASVCAEHCCRCAPGRAVQRVRACIDERCAERDAACAAARAAVPGLCE